MRSRAVTSTAIVLPLAAFAIMLPMSILTNRELEFLASLNTNWRRLYFTELARLLEEDERRCGADERRQRKPELFEVSTRLPS